MKRGIDRSAQRERAVVPTFFEGVRFYGGYESLMGEVGRTPTSPATGISGTKPRCNTANVCAKTLSSLGTVPYFYRAIRR